MNPKIGIVTYRGDLHAEAVLRSIQKICPEASVHIFEVDALCDNLGFLSFLEKKAIARLTDKYLHDVSLDELHAVWWRRSSFPQLSTEAEPNTDESHLINRDSQAFIEGIFLTIFRGAWVNHPYAARQAENKLVQIFSAQKIGLAVPATVFTNCRIQVEAFAREVGHCVVKSIAGVPGKSLLTKELNEALANEDVDISASPACFQKRIDGVTHLRILVTGSECVCARITSIQLDSREDAHKKIEKYQIPIELKQKLRLLLDELQLSMGIFDLKIDEAQKVHFFEVNQQGQFLYLDAIADCRFVDTMSRHLIAVSQKEVASLDTSVVSDQLAASCPLLI
jgi:hypothetical protein